MKTKLTKTQISILVFFIFMLLFLFLSLLLIILAGKGIYHILFDDKQLVLIGTSGFGVEKKVQNFPYVFSLIDYGFNFIFSMRIKNPVGEMLTTNLILMYQSGYFFLIIMIPFCGLGFFISMMVYLLKIKIASLGPQEQTTNDNDSQLLDDLKTNMNQIQDYLIKLHGDVKALKKITGLITPKAAKPEAKQGNDVQITGYQQDLDLIQEKQSYQQRKEMLKTGEDNGSEQRNSKIERPKSLVDPTEYIMPKRDEDFVNDFPTQQFLSTEMLPQTKNEKNISLSSIYDRKKLQTELQKEDTGSQEESNDGQNDAFSLKFNDSTIIAEKTFREKVGFDLNNYDYTIDERNNIGENQSLYQVGDWIIEDGVEYEIISIISSHQNDEIEYELTLKSGDDGKIKTIIKK